ncbi:hypothetical protein [Deinococcus sp. 12RED42]|uniref:hypothetical protein n=1 Tax=Deinococcus sp. 12RED42 TaxID=2745872 RepID=UPI001E5954A2|nr:hypothetical protein [Deinococcus sp. 12RED42]MCD0164276.1 hypothetical protein [Deinococcus sp. 12RED42]
MRFLAPLALLLSTSALAAPLLGTTNSFATSPFCVAYQCELEGKSNLGPNLTEYRYSIRGQYPVSMENAPTVVTVIRQNNRVISANYVTGAQDGVMYPGGYNNTMFARLVETLTGKRPTPDVVSKLEDVGGKMMSQEGEGIVPWVVAGKTYRLSCLMTSEFINAVRVSFRVYLP